MEINYGTVIRRALAAGSLGGLALSLYLLVVVEPVLDEAIALEQLAGETTADDGHDHGEEALFDRGQQVLGGMTATLVYGVLAALTFGTVYAAVRHRFPGHGELSRVLTLAAVTFGAVALVPAVKYPANPPAVGDPASVDQRALWYLALLAVSVAVAAALVHLSGRLRRTGLDDATRTVALAAATVVAYGAVLLVLPDGSVAVDPSVPADLIWRFRLRSLGGLALLWAVIGLSLGWSMARAEAGSTRPISATVHS
jgi:predicted cobalt transporter CbtA